jgi:hypothetical protein
VIFISSSTSLSVKVLLALSVSRILMKVPNNKDAHLDGAIALQEICRHDRTVFGESVWHRSSACAAPV